MKIPTWNEIKTLHPKLTPVKTTSRLATAQGSTLTNYGKIQLFLVPTKTMEQNKLLNKPFKQTFHITDIKPINIGIPFITKYIPTNNILDSKINIKDKYTRMQNTALTFFQRMNKQPSFFQSFTPFIMKKENILNQSQDTFTNFQIKKFTNTTNVKIDNISICLILNLDQFTTFQSNNFIHKIHEKLKLRYHFSTCIKYFTFQNHPIFRTPRIL